MNNKAFAFDCINRLLQAEKLNDATIRILVDGAECKRLFNCVRNSAVLKEVPSNTTEEDLTALCKDGACRRAHLSDHELLVWSKHANARQSHTIFRVGR